MAGKAQWTVKPTKFATVQKTVNGKKVWVKPAKPSGGTVASTPRSAAVNRLVPRDYVGSEGVVGPYTSEPRLNPDKYEWAKNPENGKWFARPINELTGLNPQQRADIKASDAQTTAQSQRIQQAYNDAATATAADAASTQSALQGLAAARGSGYAAADPTGQVLGQAARDSSAASFAPTIASLGRQAGVMRDSGLTNLQTFLAAAQKQRTDTIAGYRNAQQEAATAARDSNLKYLSDLAGNKTDLAKAKLSSDTSLATAQLRADTAEKDRAAKLRVEAAKIEAQVKIAKERGQTQRAENLQKRADAKRKLARRASNSDLRQWTERARSMWEGIPRTVAGADGKNTTQYLQYSAKEIVNELIAMGATPQRAKLIASNVGAK